MSLKSVPQECPATVSHKSVLQERPTRASYKSVPQEFPTRVSHKSVPQECPVRVSHKSFLQECPTRVSYKSVIWTYVAFRTCLHSGSWAPSCFDCFVHTRVDVQCNAKVVCFQSPGTPKPWNHRCPAVFLFGSPTEAQGLGRENPCDLRISFIHHVLD